MLPVNVKNLSINDLPLMVEITKAEQPQSCSFHLWQTSLFLVFWDGEEIPMFLLTQDNIPIQCNLHHTMLVEHHVSYLQLQTDWI